MKVIIYHTTKCDRLLLGQVMPLLLFLIISSFC